MKAFWKKVVGFAGNLFKGAAGWQTYAVIIGLVVVGIGGTIYWFNSKLEAAHTAGVESQQFEQVKSDLGILKNVVDADKESQNALQQELEHVATLRARIVDLERVRRTDAARIEQLVRAASESSLRDYATQAERDIAVVERSRDGFAEEAMQASTAAWGHRDTMLSRREAIRKQRGQLRPEPETKE